MSNDSRIIDISKACVDAIDMTEGAIERHGVPQRTLSTPHGFSVIAARPTVPTSDPTALKPLEISLCRTVFSVSGPCSIEPG